ncbi:M48 family metallopeptidase [Croceicoccus naphthovorans]|uniref:Uncharacterized protein n=1 Tax=Croceicoccus naphthovorans TaxID=1348774 RepID=A0A0G3XCA1_9SPHN|nr:SprT family zinc-dependent metalloprotease [Croceicoccus naphthovorans]AKM08817.1 hypothetical protein AB433_00525 [Croceicoccus naphthovorans]MBB3991712.1 hypothetical protein [Croceicoccus naphthovorans]
MTSRARRGLESFLKRKAAPPTEWRGTLAMPDGTALPLIVRRHPTARRLTLRLSADGNEARVSIPRWAPFSEGADFARSRSEWLASRRSAVPKAQDIVPGSTVPYRGRTLRIVWESRLPRTPALVGDDLRIGGPQDAVARRIARWLEGELLAFAAADLSEFCARADRPVPEIKSSRARRRWGSCSNGGTVRINWRLIMAPDHVRRSVVAHEVAHLVHFDHSPRFYALLARIADPDLAAAERWLKRHGPTLYAQFD